MLHDFPPAKSSFELVRLNSIANKLHQLPVDKNLSYSVILHRMVTEPRRSYASQASFQFQDLKFDSYWILDAPYGPDARLTRTFDKLTYLDCTIHENASSGPLVSGTSPS